jgi:hypothetical protein
VFWITISFDRHLRGCRVDFMGGRHPVSDVDRAKEFYGRLEWRLDADYDNGNDFRVIQVTTPAASTPAPTSPTCLGGSESAVRIPRIAATARLSPSAIPTAMAGCCRRSRSGSRAGV